MEFRRAGTAFDWRFHYFPHPQKHPRICSEEWFFSSGGERQLNPTRLQKFARRLFAGGMASSELWKMNYYLRNSKHFSFWFWGALGLVMEVASQKIIYFCFVATSWLFVRRCSLNLDFVRRMSPLKFGSTNQIKYIMIQ